MLAPNAAVVGPVGEVQGPWATPAQSQLFQMPQVTYQNSNSMNNGHWGNSNGYRGSQQQNTRSKPQYSANRLRPSYKQAQESGRPTAPPPWQAPASPTSGPFQQGQGQAQAEGPAAVNLQDLPNALCRQNFLEAMMDQAGLTENVLGIILGQDYDVGKALITLADRNTAEKCAAHFHGCSWGSGGPPVTAQVVDVPTPQNRPANKGGSRGLDKAPGGKTRKARNSKMSNVPMKMAGSEQQLQLPYGAVIQPGFVDNGGYSKQDWNSDDREQEGCSTYAGGSSRGSWDTTASSFCACDTDDGF